jgi:hypothetical protein
MSTDPVPDLHRLVDGLPPAALRRILHVVLGELQSAAARSALEEHLAPEPVEARRTLSFIGLIEDDPGAAERSEEILCEEFRRRA